MGVCASSKSQIKMVASQAADSLNGTLKGKSDKLMAKKDFTSKLVKRDSNMNMLPPEQQKMIQQSDETVFEREKRMAVLLVPSAGNSQAQLAFIDVDFQSNTYCKVLARMTLPNLGDEIYHFACIRNARSSSRLFTATLEGNNSYGSSDSPNYSLPSVNNSSTNSFTLIVPVPNNSCIYVVSVMLADASGEDFPMQLRLQKCVSREDLGRWDVGAPLSVVSNNAGRQQASLPLLLCACSDKNDHTKGDLLRLDRRTFAVIESRRRNVRGEDNCSLGDDDRPVDRLVGGYQHSSAISSPQSSPLIGAGSRFSHYGGSLAVHIRQELLFSTEWGNLTKILGMNPRLYDSTATSHSEDFGSQIYGHALNIWDMGRSRLRQTLKLNPIDGRWTICIRMLHHAELTHGFVCSAIGSCIFHLHKSSKTGLFLADRVIKFSSVALTEWSGDIPEIPAFCTDMAISMDDRYLYCCAAFHGFVAQFNISDPFRPSLTQKIFLGGLLYKYLGVLPSGCNRSTESSFQLIHVDQDGKMELDEQFLINFDALSSSNLTNPVDVDNPIKLMTSNGKSINNVQLQDSSAYCLREMRFLNGDSTSDYISAM